MNDKGKMMLVRKTVRLLRERYLRRGVKTASDRRSPFRILISTILSARTKDETTARVASLLFRSFPTVRSLAHARLERVARLIKPIGFFRVKARNIVATARVVEEQHRGRVPATMEALLSLPGVGRKTANIVLSYAFGQPAIAVDVHVQRITNRLGWVRTTTPKETEDALGRVVPLPLRSIINDTFVKFGKDICRPRTPQCWRCPVSQRCAYPRKVAKPDSLRVS